MKKIRIGLHSFVLVLADLVGIGGGAMAAFHIAQGSKVFSVQMPIAVVFSVGSFCVWIFLLRFFRFGRLQLDGPGEFAFCLLLSFLWAPLVFVFLHYFTQGYWTSVENLISLAFYQLPVNILALAASGILKKEGPTACA